MLIQFQSIINKNKLLLIEGLLGGPRAILSDVPTHKKPSTAARAPAAALAAGRDDRGGLLSPGCRRRRPGLT